MRDKEHILVKFISACGGVQYREIPEDNTYMDYYIAIYVEPLMPFGPLEDIAYIEPSRRTFRYDGYEYDQIHKSNMPVYKEYIKSRRY